MVQIMSMQMMRQMFYSFIYFYVLYLSTCSATWNKLLISVGKVTSESVLPIMNLEKRLKRKKKKNIDKTKITFKKFRSKKKKTELTNDDLLRNSLASPSKIVIN